MGTVGKGGRERINEFLLSLQHNSIRSNTLSNVWIKGSSAPTLRFNTIAGGRDSGVCVYQEGGGLIAGTAPTVRLALNENLIVNNVYLDNIIEHNAGTGLLVVGNSMPRVDRNDIAHNGGAGVEIAGAGGMYVHNEVSTYGKRVWFV